MVFGRADPHLLRQIKSGALVAQVARRMGITEATFYLWKKRYAHLSVTELPELRQLREENAKLKRLVVDLTLDKVMLQEVLGKKDGLPPPNVSGCDLLADSRPVLFLRRGLLG